MGIFGRRSAVTSVGPDGLRALLEAGAQLIDVRTDEEWAAGHLGEATHIPMEALGARLGEIDDQREVVFVCRSGRRSHHAATALAQHGYRTVNLAGGMHACARAGLPVITDGGGPGRVA